MFNFLIVRTNHSSALFLLFYVKFVVFKLLHLIKPDNPSLFLNLMKKGAFEKANYFAQPEDFDKETEHWSHSNDTPGLILGCCDVLINMSRGSA